MSQLVRLALLGLIWLPVQPGTFAQVGQRSESLRVEVGMRAVPITSGRDLSSRWAWLRQTSGPRSSRLESPARTWLIGTEFKPIATSGIGAVVAQQNLFLSRFRVVATRPGTLEIPAILAQIDGRSGRSQPRRLEIQPVPLEGRPAEFLGGVGQFTARAEAVPSVIRFGQELNYRITVTGPAAWGTTARPDLDRLRSQEAGLRVADEPDETTNEPPSRTFVYHIRPNRAGEIVLPPVPIAAFDPAVRRYVTRVTSSVSVRVVEVPSFNPATIEELQTPTGPARSLWVEWTAWSLSAVLLGGASVALARVRRRRQTGPRHGPAAARAFALRLARTLRRASGCPGHDDSSSRELAARAGASGYRCWVLAHRISEDLTRYLELGAGRPPGALTPIEARQGVVAVTGSDDLGSQAERLAADCDLALYGERNGDPTASDLLESARQLFQALGRVKLSRERGPEQPRRELERRQTSPKARGCSERDLLVLLKISRAAVSVLGRARLNPSM